jgi:hypothetical protein
MREACPAKLSLKARPKAPHVGQTVRLSAPSQREVRRLDEIVLARFRPRTGSRSIRIHPRRCWRRYRALLGGFLSVGRAKKTGTSRRTDPGGWQISAVTPRSPASHQRRAAQGEEHKGRRLGNGKSRLIQCGAVLPEDIGDQRRGVEALG